MTFTKDQLKDLKAPLLGEHVLERKQGTFSLSYIEGWHAIAEANRIFGFHGWMRQTDLMECVHDGTYMKNQSEMHTVTYISQVTVTVYTEGPFPVVRQGTGAGHGKSQDLGLAHESAAKEAETDAMKRALMTFGNQFGLALYDKSRKNVAKKGQGFVTPLPMTKLKDALRAFEKEVASCDDEDQLTILLNSQKELTDQCQRDLPKWWATWKLTTGEESVGMEERIEEAMKRVRETET